VLAGVTGGLSGPAIRPLALRCVWQVHEALPDVPIFGVGGIRTGLDALEFILAGASAVQVGTVIFNDPGAPARISRELREAIAERGMDSLQQVIGLGHRPPEEIIPELPDPPGDELYEPEHIDVDASDLEADEQYDDEEYDEADPSGADAPFDIEALDDYPSGDQDA
jgi:tRNA-dihydrouridine synthase